jgi:hypothetical protein
MKIKGLFIFAILLCLFSTKSASAQYYDQAIGGRFGTDIMIGYKRFFLYTPDPQMAWEVSMGFQLDERQFGRNNTKPQTNGYIVQGNWYWHFDIGFDTNFSGFVGAGIFLGVYTPQGDPARFGGGMAAIIGATYTFTHVPIDIQIDWMPILGDPRLSLARGGLTIRYIIPTVWQ